MKRKVSFMFVNAANVEPKRVVIDLGEGGEMIVVGVKDYAMACEQAKLLADEGVLMIELCGGFGTLGHAEVVKAVEGKCQVGVVRFDNHPGYANLSGDTKWF